jgi:hypothetical protein
VLTINLPFKFEILKYIYSLKMFEYVFLIIFFRILNTYLQDYSKLVNVFLFKNYLAPPLVNKNHKRGPREIFAFQSFFDFWHLSISVFNLKSQFIISVFDILWKSQDTLNSNYNIIRNQYLKFTVVFYISTSLKWKTK